MSIDFVFQCFLLVVMSFCSSFIWCVVFNLYYSEVKKAEVPPGLIKSAFWTGGLVTSLIVVSLMCIREISS